MDEAPNTLTQALAVIQCQHARIEAEKARADKAEAQRDAAVEALRKINERAALGRSEASGQGITWVKNAFQGINRIAFNALATPQPQAEPVGENRQET